MTALAIAAQRLAESGCAVFPVRPRAKTPITEHGVSDATRDPLQIRSWWRQWPSANIGVATGPSGLLVVDLDGPEGLAAWRQLLADHPASRTLTARTGGGGFHLYYLAPAARRLGNSAGRIAPKIDTRGHGGYALAPPSVHPSGTAYQWCDGQPGSLADLPTWIADRLEPPPPARLAARPAVTGNGYAAAALRSAVERVSTAPEGTRNATLNCETYSLARLLADGSIDPREAVAQLVTAAANAGLPMREAVATITSALRARVGAVA